MKIQNEVKLGNITFSNDKNFNLIGGINVIEGEELLFDCAKIYKEVCDKLSINLVFKASYDKANRSSFNSYRGPGIVEGLDILKELKMEYDLYIISDVHSPEEAKLAAKVIDIIQLPAFLARQTDLISALAETGKIINIKKPQFLSPNQMRNIINKFLHFGNNNLLVCERGHCFGYDNLVVDMLGFGRMKKTCENVPLIFDVTHSLQCREAGSVSSGGRRNQVLELAKSGISLGIAGIFLEAHPFPNEALCDGSSALPIDKLEDFLSQIKTIDDVIKKLPNIEIN